jgi:hypothetical protein
MPDRHGSPKLCAMTVKRVVIGFVVAVVLVLAIFAAVVASALNSLSSGDHPDVDFQGKEIAAARRAAIPQVEAQLDAVERRYGLEHVGPRGRHDHCEAGHSDFTREDAHAYVCRMLIVQVMPVGKPFKEQAALLGEALLEGDCPHGTDTDRALAKPFSDVRYVPSSRGDCEPGYHIPSPMIDGWLPARPSADRLELATYLLPGPCRRSFPPEHCEEIPLDLRAAVAAAPADAAYLAIVVAGWSDEYYEIEWE